MPHALHFLVLALAGWVNRTKKIASILSGRRIASSGSTVVLDRFA